LLRARPASQGRRALLPVGGTALVIAAGSESVLARRLLGNRPATWIGDRSYGWYLWHWPVIVYARALWPVQGWVPTAASLAALLPAAASFTYVEDPIRRRRTLTDTRVRVIAVGSSIIGALASVVLLGAMHAVARTGPGADWAKASVQHTDRQRGCESTAPLDASKVSSCTWGVPHPQGRIVLIGDSTASAVSEAVVSARNRAGLRRDDLDVLRLSLRRSESLRVDGSYGRVQRDRPRRVTNNSRSPAGPRVRGEPHRRLHRRTNRPCAVERHCPLRAQGTSGLVGARATKRARAAQPRLNPGRRGRAGPSHLERPDTVRGHTRPHTDMCGVSTTRRRRCRACPVPRRERGRHTRVAGRLVARPGRFVLYRPALHDDRREQDPVRRRPSSHRPRRPPNH
jgi:hypothetical protein